jgi:hypothetical protein
MKSLNHSLACPPHVLPRLTTILLAAILLSLTTSAQGKAQSENSFRWLSPTADTAAWAQIQSAFKPELQPDTGNPDDGPVFAYKFLERVGLVGDSALVIIGHKTARFPPKDDEGERFSSAFNFDLKTGTKASIEHADRMWHWNFKTLAQFDSSGAPDVAYTYLTCWECEPSAMFSVFRYDPEFNIWKVRGWEVDRMIWWTEPDGLVLETDVSDIADTESFVCLYGLVDLQDSGSDQVANRCHEITGIGGTKKIVTDLTVLCSLTGERLTVTPVTDLDQIAVITSSLCRQKRTSALCKVPPASTYGAPQLTLRAMFPEAPATARKQDCFRSFQGDLSMFTVVDKCGRPDNGGGAEIGFFEYQLNDGSKITIHWTDMLHIRDMVLSDKAGQTKVLFAKN